MPVAMLFLLVASVAARPARADSPTPQGDVMLVPPPPQAPSPLEPAAATSTKPAEFLPGAHPSKLAAYLFGGAAVVGLGVGIAFGVLALNDQSDYSAKPSGASLGSANQDAVIADVGLGAAVIAGVTSVVLFLKPDEPVLSLPAAPNATSSVSFAIAPTFAPHSAGAGVVLRF
jgi:hypothetical protein